MDRFVYWIIRILLDCLHVMSWYPDLEILKTQNKYPQCGTDSYVRIYKMGFSILYWYFAGRLCIKEYMHCWRTGNNLFVSCVSGRIFSYGKKGLISFIQCTYVSGRRLSVVGQLLIYLNSVLVEGYFLGRTGINLFVSLDKWKDIFNGVIMCILCKKKDIFCSRTGRTLFVSCVSWRICFCGRTRINLFESYM